MRRELSWTHYRLLLRVEKPVYVNYYHREMTAEDENPPIGIILCTDKSEAVVRYTLPEGNNQFFASRYKLYLPTEEELAAELVKERQAFEMESDFLDDNDDINIKEGKQ